MIGHCLAALLIGSAAQATAPDPAPIEEWSPQTVLAMGRAIYDHDTAAWVATDAMLEHLDERRRSAIRGWIVNPDGSDFVVRFVGGSGVARPIVDVRVSEGQVVSVDNGRGTLSAQEAAQFRARETAKANVGPLLCSSRMNTVVIDDPDSDDWLVWLLTSTTEHRMVPVGGHYRFRISADGSQLIRRDLLSRSCLTLERSEADTSGLFVTHIVSSAPVETHVFLSLQNDLPFYVLAGGQTFVVDGDRVEPTQRPTQ
jgi:hypothetical protein